MASADLDTLRRQVTYQPSRWNDIDGVFAEVANTARSLVADHSRLDRMERGGEWDDLAELLAGAYEPIRVLVGSELDTVTPGERGLGRLSTRIPRLGGEFRSRVATTPVSALGAPMEDLCIAGFAAGALIDTAGRDGRTRYRRRDPDTLLSSWIAHGVGNWDSWSKQVVEVVDSCSRPQTERFLAAAQAAGLTRGLHGKRKQEALESIAFMLVAAGRNLLSAHGEYNDARFRG
jgi:hypothetical protein